MKDKWREWLEKAGGILTPRHSRSPDPAKGTLSRLALLFFAGVGLMLLVSSWTGLRTGTGGSVGGGQVFFQPRDTPTQKPTFPESAASPKATSPEDVPGTIGGAQGIGFSGSGDEAYRRDLAKRLQRILSAIEGAGEVEVEVVLAAGTRNEYAVRENLTERRTQERDSSGGTRSTSETTKQEELAEVSVSGSAGGDAPVVVVARQPEIAGVVVVAEGATDANVREQLSRAVHTLLGIPLHRVEVFARRR